MCGHHNFWEAERGRHREKVETTDLSMDKNDFKCT